MYVKMFCFVILLVFGGCGRQSETEVSKSQLGYFKPNPMIIAEGKLVHHNDEVPIKIQILTTHVFTLGKKIRFSGVFNVLYSKVPSPSVLYHGFSDIIGVPFLGNVERDGAFRFVLPEDGAFKDTNYGDIYLDRKYNDFKVTGKFEKLISENLSFSPSVSITGFSNLPATKQIAEVEVSHVLMREGEQLRFNTRYLDSISAFAMHAYWDYIEAAFWKSLEPVSPERPSNHPVFTAIEKFLQPLQRAKKPPRPTETELLFANACTRLFRQLRTQEEFTPIEVRRRLQQLTATAKTNRLKAAEEIVQWEHRLRTYTRRLDRVQWKL